MKTNESQTMPSTSVKIGEMEMVVTEQSLADLCEIKEHSSAFRDAIARIMKTVITLGVGYGGQDKTEYLYMASELQNMSEHYEKIARIRLLREGEEVAPLE